MTACDDCLRRGYLLRLLAPRVSDLLGRPGRDRQTLLALDDDALITAVCGRGERSDAARHFVGHFDPAPARDALEAGAIFAVCRHAATYPSRLSELRDPPAVLFLTSPPERLEALVAAPSVTIVGTREPSGYGLEMARGLGQGLAAAGVTVVSGLALGIDAAAHLGAGEADPTRALAVIARGPELPYPRRHAALYRVVRSAGCVLSELPPGTGVHKWAFPARNRIMAALADMTVVVEAADPSGSLITAAFALDLDRTVGAVPGRANSTHSRGTNRLIRDGAQMVETADDVLALFEADGRSADLTRPDSAADLEPELRAVLFAVERCDHHQDLAELAGLEPGPLRAALGRLEMLGLIRRDAFGAYVRTAS